MFEAVADGRLGAIWIMATNPAVSLPEAERVREALARCPFVVVSDCVRRTDTSEYANVLLPAAAWGEKDGTVTNSERRISRQRAFLPPPGEARPDWWIVCEVARRLGHGAAFDYRGPADIFREHARLSGFENDGRRLFDISALAALSDEEYDRLDPVQWPIPPAAAGRGTERLFADGRFPTPSGRARFVAVTPRPPARAPSVDFPFVLNTGRVRDQWHTMTRTGKSARLNGHTPEPYVEIHPEDAMRLGLAPGGLARLKGPLGGQPLCLRVAVSAGQRRGSVFVPIHWSGQNASAARVGALIPAVTDPVSGEPEFKHAPVRVEPCTPAWHGFVLSRRRLHIPGVLYQVTVRGQAFWRHEIAGTTAPEDWHAWARALLCTPCEAGTQAEWIEYHDRGLGRYHAVRLLREAGGDDSCRIESCLFAAPDLDLPSRQWLGALFAKSALDAAERAGLIAGEPLAAGSDGADGGRLICACFGVSETRLREAIRKERLDSTEAVGRALAAGTNCGSCLPTIRTLLVEASGGERRCA
jgi:assimilatory nitrate reductase catalytic subunit